ncbi:MAG TPA: CocE/NonD family hydrolase [Burkholderiales bacterium]|nr:CocE/NonD family hydrolase [Burkholderiales bacterium]
MRILWNQAVPMDDGAELRADVYLPAREARYPVIMSCGPYGKGYAFEESHPAAWKRLVAEHPEFMEGSTNRYQAWEVVDPEKWTTEGYAVVRVDSRGAGASPGTLDPWSPRETQDLYHCIEWAGTQSWSNGKVGLNGISYYAMNAWQVACLQPPHLAAFCAWEGSSDHYREALRHGGIASRFCPAWFVRSVQRVQHGLGERGPKSAATGEPVCGYDRISDEELRANRIDYELYLAEHVLDDESCRARSPDWSKVKVPFLSAANWGGQGLHTRGNFEGFVQAASRDKWLEAHGGAHWQNFYTRDGERLQRRFFGHFLKGEDTGWAKQPRVELKIRHPGEKFVVRHENEWPLERTRWTRFYLNPGKMNLDRSEPGASAKIPYETQGEGLLFELTLQESMEITGPVAAKLYLSSATNDADVFLVLRVFDPDGKEVTFQGSNDPRVPVGLGWLRASQRKLDPQKSLPYRPWHIHDESQKLAPGEAVELDIEIWPTCIVIPAGFRLALAVRGRDYESPGAPIVVPGVGYPFSGVGPFLHDDPRDRPKEVFGGTNTLHFEPGRQPYLLLPVIPR